jgi:hypothetical protein
MFPPLLPDVQSLGHCPDAFLEQFSLHKENQAAIDMMQIHWGMQYESHSRFWLSYERFSVKTE